MEKDKEYGVHWLRKREPVGTCVRRLVVYLRVDTSLSNRDLFDKGGSIDIL